MTSGEFNRTGQTSFCAEDGSPVARRPNRAISDTELPKLDSGELGDSWIDWIIVHARSREATALIEGQPTAAAEQPK